MTQPLDLAEQIAAHLATTDIEILDLTGPEGALRLVRSPGGFVVADAPEDQPPPAITVNAPGPGILLLAHPMRAEAAAPLHAHVAQGDIIGFLRIGPLLTPVRAPQSGVMVATLAQDGATVGYGTPLFELEPRENAP